METYRSGHNENDSKSFCLHGHVGSNPTVSVLFPETYCFRDFISPYAVISFFLKDKIEYKGETRYWLLKEKIIGERTEVIYYNGLIN